MNANERKIFASGAIASTLAILAFCQLSAQGTKFSLDVQNQFLFVISILLIWFINIYKTGINLPYFSRDFFFIILILISSTFSLLNTENILISIKRLIIVFGVTFITFLIASGTTNPKKLFQGFSGGIATVTAISVLYSFVAAIVDFNFINQKPYEIIEFQIFGLELQQTIAHRAYIYDGSTYYIQRYAGIFPNPNGLGLMSAISFTLTSLLIREKKLKHLFQTIFLIGLLLSLSRMGLLLCAASFIYFRLSNNFSRRAICILMIAGLFSFLFATVSTDPTRELSSPNNTLTHQELFQLRDRAHLMSKAWLGFLENWPVGVGFGVGAEYLFAGNADTLAVHSVFISTALETGVPGIAFLLAIWLLPIFTTNADRDVNSNAALERNIIAAILFGLFFAEAFDLSVMRFHYIHLIFFFLLGAWSALGRDPKNTALQDAQYSDTSQTLTKRMESSKRLD